MNLRRRLNLHLTFYFLMFGVLALSLGLMVASYFSEVVWSLYHGIYLCFLIVYTWYILVLLFFNELHKEEYTRYKNETIAVLIPLYNEDFHLFKRALRSVIKAKGNKEIFVIDDGSTKGINKKQLRKLCAETGVQLHFFATNKGKRHALYHGVRKMVSDHEFVVTIDSDTVLDENALIRVVEPLKSDNIGASTGNILLLNENQNTLTRMVGAYYWIGLNIFKKAQSTLGIVVCCSGCLAAYKTDLLKDVMEDFITQEFLGENCTHSEDRHLTNLILKRGYVVKFVEEAISYTQTPHNVSGFLKQQQRWKRGFIRESTFTLSYAWRVRPVLFMQILLCELSIPFFAFGLMIGVAMSIFAKPDIFLNVILPSWLAFMFVRYIHVFFYAKRKIPGLLIYMFFYEIFLYWQFIYALFTVRNKSWITR